MPNREMVMGREKAIESPEQLYSLFKDYKKWAKENPYLVHDYVGKDALEVHKKKERPLTWAGFEGYLSENDVLSHLGHYEQNSNDSYKEFLPIIRAIKKQCSNDTISGALAGVYNQNIAARLEGLKEQTDLNLSDNRKQVSDLFPFEEDNLDDKQN